MSTNRTKIDWAYRAAKKFIESMHFEGCADPVDIRSLAQLFRNAYRRGQRVPERDGETGGA